VSDMAKITRHIIKSRRSVRGGFTDEPVSREDLLDLVEAGTWAPSGGNWQNVRFVIVTDPAEIDRIGRIRMSWPYRSTAPPAGIIGHARALIAVFVDTSVAAWYGRHNGDIWWQLDYQSSAAAIQNMLLLAFAKELGACWVSAFVSMNERDCLRGQTWRDVWHPYDVPDAWQIHGIVMLGHRADAAIGEREHQGRPVKRRSPEEHIWSFDHERMAAK